jgi:hypothetical protein
MCGHVCTLGGPCVAGACTCAAPLTNCSGTCYNLQTDARHCGVCTTGCANFFGCCSGTCTNFYANTSCGGCGIVCSGATPTCHTTMMCGP